MTSYIAIPSAAVACALVVASVLGPSIWLTRSRRALWFRHIRTGVLLLCWVVVALPWAVVLIVTLSSRDQRISLSVHSIPGLLGAIAEALGIIVALVSLPLAVIVLTIVWFLDRQHR